MRALVLAPCSAFGRFQLREGYYTVVASQLAKWCPSSAHLLAGACGGPARAVGTPVLARPGDATLWQLSRRAGGWSLTIANGGRSCKPGGALQAPRACGSAPGVSAGVQSWTLQPAPLVAPNAFYLEAAASPKGCAQLRLGVEAGNCWTAATPRMYAAATTGGQTTWLLQPAYPPRCGGVLGALQAQGPKHAELAAVVAAVSHLVPELASSRFDVEAPVNWLVHRWDCLLAGRERAVGIGWLHFRSSHALQIRQLGLAWNARSSSCRQPCRPAPLFYQPQVAPRAGRRDRLCTAAQLSVEQRCQGNAGPRHPPTARGQGTVRLLLPHHTHTDQRAGP